VRSRLYWPQADCRSALLAAIVLLPLLSACSLVRAPTVAAAPATVPAPDTAGTLSVDPSPGRLILVLAERQIGAPYRFGGASPDGFDCSGLVLHVHGLAGLTVPRTAAGQSLQARPVQGADLQAGDLLFFASRGRGRAVDHVGIYAGDGRFVHAPRTGRDVGYDRLEDPWWAARFAMAGRFWADPVQARPPGAAPPSGVAP
jgi:cell wall-associated NlpC family hydrolase